MANKRKLKKSIRYACGDVAGECLFSYFNFGGNIEDWDKIIIKAAELQESAICRVGVSFDKTPKDFENPAEYRKARRAYFKAANKSLVDHINTEIEGMVKDMNALMPKKG